MFQSFFECQDCAQDDMHSGPASGFLLCSLCYVEGRQCKCGNLKPIQARPLSQLLNDRNKAAATLRQHGRIRTTPLEEE
jgi:hypothetical protein